MWNRRRIRTIHMICDYRNYSGHNVIIFCSFNKVDSKKLSSFKYKWELLCPFLLKKQFLVSYSLHLSNCSSNLPPPAPPPAHRNLQWQHRCFDGMKGKLCEFYPGSSGNLTCVFSCSVYLSKSFHKPERQKGEIWIQHAFTQQTRVEHLLGIRHSWWGGGQYIANEIPGIHTLEETETVNEQIMHWHVVSSLKKSRLSVYQFQYYWHFEQAGLYCGSCLIHGRRPSSIHALNPLYANSMHVCTYRHTHPRWDNQRCLQTFLNNPWGSTVAPFEKHQSHEQEVKVLIG